MTSSQIHVRTGICIATLKSRGALIAKEHRDRISSLAHLAASIQNQGETGQLDLAEEPLSLSPELERLLGDPTHGL